MWKVSNYSQVGIKNKERDLLCQDYVFYHRKDSIQVITLADGAGTNNFARIGAESACKTLALLIAENFEALYQMETTRIQFQVIVNIQTELYKLCDKYKVSLENFQSTLLGVAVNYEKGLFLTVHLGDGSIEMIKDDKSITISYPENGNNRFQTYLTSKTNVGKHIKIIKGKTEGVKKFILLSDGWNENMKRKRLFLKTIGNLPDEVYEYQDDIAFIALETE